MDEASARAAEASGEHQVRRPPLRVGRAVALPRLAEACRRVHHGARAACDRERVSQRRESHALRSAVLVLVLSSAALSLSSTSMPGARLTSASF